MVARVLFLVLPCGGTRSHPQHRATIKAFAGECEHYAMVPVHRATARDRPYSRRPGKPTHPCRVGAGLAPALPTCTPCSIRQQSPLWSPAVPLAAGLAHKQTKSVKKIRSKRATVAPYLLCTRLRSSHRLRADRLFGLDAPAPVDHRLDQLADLLARALVMQVHLLVEESGGLWHQHLRVGYHNGTNATEHPTQGGLCIC